MLRIKKANPPPTKKKDNNKNLAAHGKADRWRYCSPLWLSLRSTSYHTRIEADFIRGSYSILERIKRKNHRSFEGKKEPRPRSLLLMIREFRLLFFFTRIKKVLAILDHIIEARKNRGRRLLTNPSATKSNTETAVFVYDEEPAFSFFVLGGTSSEGFHDDAFGVRR